jgi:hypothetical protein
MPLIEIGETGAGIEGEADADDVIPEPHVLVSLVE